MVKQLMFAAAVIMAVFASCSDANEVVGGGSTKGKGVALSLNADLVAGSRIGFSPDGNGLKGSFQEGDYIILYFRPNETGWCNKTAVLYYDPASSNGSRGVFRASDVVIPDDAHVLHILMGTTKGGVPYIDAVAGKVPLANDLRTQEGTLEWAAMHSVFQADISLDDNIEYSPDMSAATINNITFKPKTAILKITATFPAGVAIEQGMPLTIKTDNTYNYVVISGGNPGYGSLPRNTAETSEFNVKVAEVDGNRATAYMVFWPNVSDAELSLVNIAANLNNKRYEGDHLKSREGRLEPGMVYRAEAEMGFFESVPQTVWINDDEQDVFDVETSVYTSPVDWLTVAGGKIHAKANTTGAPRTGDIFVNDAAGDPITYTVTQVEPADFKGTYAFTTKVFAGAGSFKAAADPATFDVTFTDPRNPVTLTDADGETLHTNNIGIEGLFYNAVMDAAVEIDYDRQTAKVGVFYDARPEEAQLITADGAAYGKYARFVPALVTRTATQWAKPWKFDETNLGDPNYTWAWFTVSSDLKTLLYANRTSNNVEFSAVSQYSDATMNQIAGIDVVLSATNDASATVPGYANVYQTNPKGNLGNRFDRK